MEILFNELSLEGQFPDEKKITFDLFVKSTFSKGKLNFSRLGKNSGLEIIPVSKQTLFLDAFGKFEKLTWDEIYNDKGFDSKEFHGNFPGLSFNQKSYKFRISKKIRCHGFREKDSFSYPIPSYGRIAIRPCLTIRVPHWEIWEITRFPGGAIFIPEWGKILR